MGGRERFVLLMMPRRMALTGGLDGEEDERVCWCGGLGLHFLASISMPSGVFSWGAGVGCKRQGIGEIYKYICILL